MSFPTQQLYVVAPLRKHKHTVIFLHGCDRPALLYDCADEFLTSKASDDIRILPEIFPTVKWVFPSSRLRMSARFETELSQWFDMWSLRNPQERKELQIDGLSESIAYLLTVIYNESFLVPAERIILGGIGQGCATAIHALLYSGIRLGGFLGLAGWLPFQEEVERVAESSSTGVITHRYGALTDMALHWDSYSCSSRDLAHAITRGKRQMLEPVFEDSAAGVGSFEDVGAAIHLNNSDYYSSLDLEGAMSRSKLPLGTPVFLAHSKDDEVVPFCNGVELRRGLEHLGMTVTWKTYREEGHWFIQDEHSVDIERVEFKAGPGLHEMVVDDIVAFLNKALRVSTSWRSSR